MVDHGQRFIFNAFVWILLVAFLLDGKVTKGTGFNVFDQKPSKESYLPDYKLYHNLSKLNECIYDLVSRYPSILDAEMRFRSRWGLSQYVLHFANLTSKETPSQIKLSKVKILLIFGEHSSEYLPVESMVNLVQNLTAGFDRPVGSYEYNFTMFVLDHVDLYMIGMVNPDGRTIIEKTQNYCWKETGSRADLNKYDNYDGLSTGRQILVEPECRVLTELTSMVDFDVAISFHSGKEQIVIPRRGSKTSIPNAMYPDNGELLVLASVLSSSSPKKLHYKFVNQTSHQYGESIFSYTATTRKIPFTYVVSLWEDSPHKSANQQCFVNANPISYKLKKTIKSFHPIYTNLFKHVVKWKRSKTEALAKKKKFSHVYSILPSFFYLPIYLVLVFFIVLFVTRVHIPLGWRLFYRRQRRIVSLQSLSSAFSFLLI